MATFLVIVRISCLFTRWLQKRGPRQATKEEIFSSIRLLPLLLDGFHLCLLVLFFIIIAGLADKEEK